MLMLVLASSLLVTFIGAAVGLLLASVFAGRMAQALQQFFPSLGMPANTFVIGALLALFLGALAGALPSAQVWPSIAGSW